VVLGGSAVTSCIGTFFGACRFAVFFGFLWFFAGYFEVVLSSGAGRGEEIRGEGA